MKSTNNCKRVVLAGNNGCRVWFCEECQVAEVEVGALSLRLELAAFCSLSALLAEASSKIAALGAIKSTQQEFSSGIGNLH